MFLWGVCSLLQSRWISSISKALDVLKRTKRAILFLVHDVLFLDEFSSSPRLFLVQLVILFLEGVSLFLVDSLYIVIPMRLFLVQYHLFLVQYVLFLDDF